MVCCIAAFSLTTACGGADPQVPTITLDGTATDSDLAGLQPTVEPDPGEDLDRAESLSGQPAGTPVTPEFLMVSVDDHSNMLSVVVYVPRIFEDGGVCTATVVNTTATLSQESPAEADASGTACGLFAFSLADLGAGTATITATYESADHQGSSSPLEVDIP
ncbi:MAG: hypothetical protein CVT64_11500 [Actinobacteria bacterium HGW-Actinobacteria-4]|nr:MAG: hypothetical protein CVT64_11500 [Actinobacteria bacterium HGW-Actinobacteria-4]